MKIHSKPMVGKYGPCWTKRGTKPTHIVLHHTASGWNGKEDTGGAVNAWNFWYGLRPGRRVSSTYILGKNGYVMRCVDPEDSAWHAGTSEWNNKSIGIEIVNWGNNKDPFPDRQMKALAELVHKDMVKYKIPKKHIIDHKRVYSGKIDMRNNFPWYKLFKYIDEKPWVVSKVDPPIKVVEEPVTPPKPLTRLISRFRVRKRRR